MSNMFFIKREGETEIDIESTYNLSVLHSPLYIEQYKDDFVRDWANEDGEDIIDNPHTRAQEIKIDLFLDGESYLSNLVDFCIFVKEKIFEYRDMNQKKKFTAKYKEVSEVKRIDVNGKQSIQASIIIKNISGRFLDVI